MRFIAKTKLVETMAANPLDKAVAEDSDVTALAQEGILTAAAAETDAINQYTQVLDLISKSEDWLKTSAEKTIQDIVAEEKKHFAQLSTLVSKLPAFEKEFAAGEEEVETGKDVNLEAENNEEVKESVEEKAEEAFNKYDSDIVIKIISEETPIEAEKLYDLADSSELLGDLYPEQVDQLLNYCGLDEETLDRIEKRVIEEADINKNKINQQAADDKDALENDIYILKGLLEDEDNMHYIKHPIIRQKIYDILSEFSD